MGEGGGGGLKEMQVRAHAHAALEEARVWGRWSRAGREIGGGVREGMRPRAEESASRCCLDIYLLRLCSRGLLKEIGHWA